MPTPDPKCSISRLAADTVRLKYSRAQWHASGNYLADDVVSSQIVLTPRLPFVLYPIAPSGGPSNADQYLLHLLSKPCTRHARFHSLGITHVQLIWYTTVFYCRPLIVCTRSILLHCFIGSCGNAGLVRPPFTRAKSCRNPIKLYLRPREHHLVSASQTSREEDFARPFVRSPVLNAERKDGGDRGGVRFGSKWTTRSLNYQIQIFQTAGELNKESPILHARNVTLRVKRRYYLRTWFSATSNVNILWSVLGTSL